MIQLLYRVNIFFTKNKLIYTFKACLAITLALGISMSLDLEKPMWAMISALFLQVRPETGFIIEKAVGLVLASFIGVIVGFMIVSLFLPYPTLALSSLCFFIAITVFFSAGMSHSNFIYAFTLANTTCLIIIFYSIATPALTTGESIFDTGYFRVTEIMIGSLCSCLVNYYIFPMKVESTLKKHVEKSLDLTINYITDIFSAEDFTNNEKYNIQVENILNNLIILDNDLSAARYENLKKENYYIFSNRIVSLIQSAHLLRKHTTKSKSKDIIKKELKQIHEEICRKSILEIKLTSDSKNILITTIVDKLNAIINSYHMTSKNTSNKAINKDYYSFKNYNNPISTLIIIFRTICLILCLSLFWINTEGNSSLLMMLVLPCVLSQLFIAAPAPEELVKKATLGILIAIPISIFITLTLLAQVVGYFELLILILLISLFPAILVMTDLRFQASCIGFCLAFICIIQPSNHMSFETSKSITVGISALVGCGVLWIVFKLFPHSPYAITRKFAIRSIIKDIKKLQLKEISEKQFQSSLIKKILCVYKNRKDDQSSERDIEFALQSLTKCY